MFFALRNSRAPMSQMGQEPPPGPAPVCLLPPAADIRRIGAGQQCAKSGCEQMQQRGCCNQRYSITSSARASSVAGMSRPSVLAVCKLITSSNRVGCSTGRSPGLSPLSTRSTVTVLHGSIVNPLDHRGVYPPLCSVLFLVGEVFGGASQDTLSVDLHEDWLD
jgi:hypothetical protein